MGATDVHNEKSEAETQNKQTQFKELDRGQKKKKNLFHSLFILSSIRDTLCFLGWV